MKLFSDLKVIELAGVLAGPSAGYFFAELGAEVIKIENPNTGGDVTRSWKLPEEDPSQSDSAYYWCVNAFKTSIQLDLTTETGKTKVRELVKRADILICNYKSGDDKKLGVDYETLKQLNPKLIYANITGFGADSPRSAYDLILQAESGFMSMNGSKPGEVLKMPVALIDLLAGHQLKEAILIALLQRTKTGKGSKLTVSLFDSAIASLANQASNWLIAGHLPKASGSLHPNIAPYGELFESRDKQLLTFAIGNNKQFKALCELIAYPALAIDKRFSGNALRVKHRSELYQILYDYIKGFEFRELYEKCLKSGIPVAKVRNLKEVFELPEAKKMLRSIQQNGKDLQVVSGIAFSMES